MRSTSQVIKEHLQCRATHCFRQYLLLSDCGWFTGCNVQKSQGRAGLTIFIMVPSLIICPIAEVRVS